MAFNLFSLYGRYFTARDSNYFSFYPVFFLNIPVFCTIILLSLTSFPVFAEEQHDGSITSRNCVTCLLCSFIIMNSVGNVWFPNELVQLTNSAHSFLLQFFITEFPIINWFIVSLFQYVVVNHYLQTEWRLLSYIYISNFVETKYMLA